MKTIKRLLARATAAACLTAVFLSSSDFAQAQHLDYADSAFDKAVAVLTADEIDWMAENEATRDIGILVSNERTHAPVISALDWQNYGERLHDALSLDHTGIRHSALRLIIAYSDQLELGTETIVDLMHIYREDESEQARRMAVVALAELDSKLAVDYLERAHSFEKSDAVRKTIAAVVSAHRAT
jgi:HEAT repeat protein